MTRAFGVTDLVVDYGEGPAVRGVSCAVPAGEVTAVVGGDGSGKTTLLRALAGAVGAAAGTVRSPGRARTGYVPSGPGCYPDLTVDENVAFAAAAYRVPPAEARARAAALLAATGLEAARGRLAAQLSGGMRRKLAFALAVLHRPELLVLDEPTTGVDPVSRVDLWRLVARAAAEGTAVAWSTIYLDEAERAAAVLVLHDGRALATGTPDAIVRAVPGCIVETDAPREPSRAWRRGARFREWRPAGDAGDDRTVAAGLEDAVIVAALLDEHAAAAGAAR